MYLGPRPERCDRVFMGQRLSRFPRQMTVELPNGSPLLVEGQPIIEINVR